MEQRKFITVGRLLLGAGICACCCFGCSKGEKITWQTEKVVRSTMSEMVSATGTVEAVTSVDVGTQVSGIIDKIYVDYNSVVKKGQLIAEMDKVTLEAQLASQEAQLASAKAEYDYQQKNYARNKVLFEKELISDSEYETATYDYERAKSAYEQAEANIVSARQNLGYAVITSPIDGVVISREVEEGQTVAAGFDEGMVTQVRLEATVESNVVTYEVVISAPNPELKLKPGLTATVSIYTLEKPNVLTIAPKAMRFVPDEALAAANDIILKPLQVENPAVQKTVWIRNGQTLEEREVKIGTTTTLMAEVVGGLTEGQEVVVGMELAGKGAIGAPNPGNTESSPFMPKPPGSEKNNKKK